MDANQILQSDILDILFEGKNKSYGAYDLRKTYHKRIEAALALVLLLIVAAIVSSFIASKFRQGHTGPIIITTETTVHSLPKDEPKPIVLPRHILPPVPVASKKFTIPVITKRELVVEPPTGIKEIENTRIDAITTFGKEDEGIINPPSDEIGNSVIQKPENKKTEEDAHFKKVEVEASFPGGDKAWQRYIQRAIASQLDEFAETDYGTCIVQFIVDQNGKVSEVTATTMQGTKLAEIAVNTIRKGPDWTPAIQNGHYVTARRLQPVTLLNPIE
jgi:periplasmic protein TonB